jgi:hypothetical protein
MKRTAIACAMILGGAGVASAQVADDEPQVSTALINSRLPSGPDAATPGLGASVEGGWGGAHAKAVGKFVAEGLIAERITLRAGVQIDNGTARPSAGASYVFLDAATHPVGLLAGLAYKPEGLTEPEGEVEGTVALSRRIGDGLASASITYGQDPDFNEHDAELALGAVTPVAPTLALGGVARARSGLGSSKDLGVKWDSLAGGVARLQVEQYTITAVAGAEMTAPDSGGTKLGVMGTLAVGAWW